MFRPLSLAIGLRYLRAKRRNGFISFISRASILGILLGVMALITTISVMNGFQEELRSRILGMVSHATIDGVDGPLQDWPKAVAQSKRDSRVLGAAPYIQAEALLQGLDQTIRMVLGVYIFSLPFSGLLFIERNVFAKLSASSRLLIGRPRASRCDVAWFISNLRRRVGRC